MYMIFIMIYLIICILIGYAGRNRKFGFWGFLFCSIFLTPITGFVAYLASCEKLNLIVNNNDDVVLK